MQRQAMSCHAIPCNTIQMPPTQSHSMSYNTRQCHARPCNAVTCNAMQCNAMPRNATPHRAMQLRSMPCNTIPHHEIHSNAMQNMSNCTRNWLMIVATMYHHTKGTNCLEICHIAPKIGTIPELPYAIIPYYDSIHLPRNMSHCTQNWHMIIASIYNPFPLE